MRLSELNSFIKDKDHVIWDWNGTLLNDVEHAVKTMNQLLIEFRLPLIDSHRYRQVFEFPVINYYETLGFDVSDDSFQFLCEKFVSQFMADFRNCPLHIGIKELLVQTKETEKLQSILSATDQTSLNEMIDHFEIRHLFDFVYGISDKKAASKLTRGISLVAESRVEKQRTVLIGDTLHDLEVGKELGIGVVLIGHGHQCSTILRKNHPHVISF
jgi:phosphoglycolate phosphatase